MEVPSRLGYGDETTPRILVGLTHPLQNSLQHLNIITTSHCCERESKQPDCFKELALGYVVNSILMHDQLESTSWHTNSKPTGILVRPSSI